MDFFILISCPTFLLSHSHEHYIIYDHFVKKYFLFDSEYPLQIQNDIDLNIHQLQKWSQHQNIPMYFSSILYYFIVIQKNDFEKYFQETNIEYQYLYHIF